MYTLMKHHHHHLKKQGKFWLKNHFNRRLDQQCDRGLSISWLTTQPISGIVQRSFYAFINVYTYDESKY